MKKVLMGPVWVAPRSKWLVDVFTGSGFDSHHCFRIYKGSLKLVSGTPLTESDYQQLQAFL